QANLVSWVKQTMGLTVHQTTISRLIKNKEEIGENPMAKRQRIVQHPVTNRFTCNTQPDTALATVCLKGKKINKERLTLALCANADGIDKMISFVIAWMTVLLFQKWLKKFDLKMAGHNIILLIDNAKVHSVGNLRLRNTTIRFFPLYTTSRLQPIDAGVIMFFKCNYRSYFIKWLLDQYESEKDNKIDVLIAIKFIVRGWREEPQQVESDEEDNSVETPQITHKEALDAIHRLELYLMQQDLNYVVQTENDVALSKLNLL
ncbi:27728_t:CDS:2, partial [Dentiscutata erythropus]